MKGSKTVVFILFNALFFGCESSTEPQLIPGVWGTFDRQAYKFTTQTVRDTAYLTVYNQSDTTVLWWTPSEVIYKSDTAWVIVEWQDRLPFGPLAPHARSTVRFFFDDFGPPTALLPDGIYKVGIEYLADTAVVKAHAYRVGYSGEATVTH